VLEAGVIYLFSFIETRDSEVSSSETLTATNASLKVGIFFICLFNLSSSKDCPLQMEKESSNKSKHLPIELKVRRI
jgi:hypothetical protein